MAITTGDGYIASAKQKVRWTKTATATTVAAQWWSLLDKAGEPGAGSFAVGNTANGLVPTDLTGGFPVLKAFGGGAAGYLSIVGFSSTVACRMALYDRLFHVGSISLTALATTTLASQPSYSGRLPGGDYSGLEIWLEIGATAVSATATTVSVTYMKEDNATGGRSTGATASLSGFGIGRLVQLPLAAGDKGVSKIESVTVGGTVATTGVVNVIVARPLWTAGRVKMANDGDIHGIDKTGMPVVYADSALWPIVAADSTSSGIPDLLMEVVNG